MSVVHLSEKRAEVAASHAEKVKRMFEDHPELAEGAIIINADSCIALLPESMDPLEAATLLDKVSFSLKFQVHLSKCEG